LDSGVCAPERNPRERAARERAYKVCQEWLEKSDGRYEIITHLDDIGSRHHKNWFLLNDSTVRLWSDTIEQKLSFFLSSS
jgi:PX domain-containing protein kinase-like protein